MARGSIRRADSGWGYRVDAGMDPSTGKRRQISKQGFATKREAQESMRDLMRKIDDGVTPRRSQMTLGEYLDDWLQLQHDRLRPSTWHSYEIAVNRIKAELGHAKLQALAPLEIERYYAMLLKPRVGDRRALAPKTVRNTHIVLRKALADAERLQLIIRNPAAAAHPPAVPRSDHMTWTSDELSEFLQSIDDQRLYAAFVLLATTGMRRGEALGLRWRDLDFDSGELAVANTLTTAGFNDVVSGAPKTPRSRRQIFLDDGTLTVLREHRRLQRAERLAAGSAWKNVDDLVFVDEFGAALHPDLFSNLFQQLLKTSGLPRIRLHDLRHSYATLALKAGVHPKVVSERLGHATIGVTLDLYSHVTPSIAKDAASVVADRILPGGHRA